jgi:ABC-2 type transport system permease protein
MNHTAAAQGDVRTRVSGMAVALMLTRRELIRFVRQPARIAAAIGTPALLWLLMGSGFADALKPDALGDDIRYAAFLLPGMMTLVAVFAAIFSSISSIEDRQQGWLQAVLVAPAPRWSIALGRVLGGATVAFAQAAVLLPAAPLLGLSLGPVEVVAVLIALAVTSIAMAAVGAAFAWVCQSTASFHAVMNLLFMPMWLLSGAFFPPDAAATWLRWIVAVNPLSWCTEAIRGPMLGEPWAMSLLLAGAFALVALALATRVITRPDRAR